MGDGRRVFISYTSEMAAGIPRLGNFVEAAERGVADADFVPKHMRQFNASPQPPAQVCREAVSSCDIFVGLVGFRGGSLVPRLEPPRSYVQLELDTARGRRMPCLLFLLDEDAPVPAGYFDPRSAGRQREFRRQLQTSGLTTHGFRTPDGLQSAVRDSLRQLVAPRPPQRDPGRPPVPRPRPRGIAAGLVSLAAVAAVALLVIFVALPALRGTSFWTQLFGDSSTVTERLARESSATAGKITMTVTSVGVADATTRVGIRVANGSSSTVTLPVFGNAQLVEAGGAAHEADPHSSSWDQNVGPGLTVSGTIVFADPIATSATSVDVGFATVFGTLEGPNSVYVRGVPLKPGTAPT